MKKKLNKNEIYEIDYGNKLIIVISFVFTFLYILSFAYNIFYFDKFYALLSVIMCGIGGLCIYDSFKGFSLASEMTLITSQTITFAITAVRNFNNYKENDPSNLYKGLIPLIIIGVICLLIFIADNKAYNDKLKFSKIIYIIFGFVNGLITLSCLIYSFINGFNAYLLIIYLLNLALSVLLLFYTHKAFVLLKNGD